MDEKTRLKWAEFNSDGENVPPCTKLIKFLDLHEDSSSIIARALIDPGSSRSFVHKKVCLMDINKPRDLIENYMYNPSYHPQMIRA